MRIPLIGAYNTRGPEDPYTASLNISIPKDQRFVNCVFTVVLNQLAKTASAYVDKRPGVTTVATQGSGTPLGGIASSWLNATIFSAVNNANNIDIYKNTTKLATISGTSPLWAAFSEVAGGIAVVINDNGTTSGYYWVSTFVTSFTGTTTNGSAVITGITNAYNLLPGQVLSGTGIAGACAISSIDSASQITCTVAATASGTVTISASQLAKFMSPNFPTNAVGPMIFADGYAFILGADGKLWNTEINQYLTILSSDYTTTNALPDVGIGMARIKNSIAAFGRNSIEFYTDTGNAIGSPLTRSPQNTISTGASDWRHIAQLGDDVYFYGTTDPFNAAATSSDIDGGRHSVWRLRGYEVQRISDNTLDAILNNAKVASLGILHACGTQYLLVNLDESGNQDRSFVYDTNLNLWIGEWVVASGSYFNTFRFLVGGNGLLGDDGTTVRILQMNPGATNAYLDPNSKSITRTIQTSKLDDGTMLKKTCEGAWIVGESTAETVSYSDDDYATWVAKGTYASGAKITRLGRFRRRAWKLVNTASSRSRLEAIEVNTIAGAT